MTLKRMDNVGIVVDDLAAAIAFFVEIDLELEGETTVERSWVDRVVGLDGVRVDVAMLRTPEGHGRLELMKFHRPTAASAEPKNAPANTLGIRRIMFAVEGIEDVLARLHAHGAELVLVDFDQDTKNEFMIRDENKTLRVNHRCHSSFNADPTAPQQFHDRWSIRLR